MGLIPIRSMDLNPSACTQCKSEKHPCRNDDVFNYELNGKSMEHANITNVDVISGLLLQVQNHSFVEINRLSLVT